MKYRLVQLVDRGLVASDFDQDAFLAAMEVRGFKPNGVEQGRHLRAELRGEPRFQELCGPMWGGSDPEDGHIVRYEDWKAYDLLST